VDDKNLKALIDLGRQAEETQLYFEANPYFPQVLERVKMGLFQTILSLRPAQRDEFMILKGRLDTVFEPLNVIAHDILAGQRALEELETGKPPAEGGIL